MAWIEKGQPTPFDRQPIPGLFFIDGDLLNRRRSVPWAKGHILPTIVFPSGAHCDLDRHPDSTNATVGVFGSLALPFFDTIEHASREAQEFSQQHWYEVIMANPQALTVLGDNDEQIIIQYDVERNQMSNVIYQRNGQEHVYPISTLFDDEARTRLPHYTAEQRPTLDDLAYIRFKTFDGWSWYAVAYDGSDTFYGLTVEDAIHLTTFSLAHLATLHDSLGQKVERDYVFEPSSLRELQDNHFHRLIAEQRRNHQRIFSFPIATREQLRQAMFKSEEVDTLTDDDLAAITISMHDHYINDLFWEEIAFHTQQLLESRRADTR